MTQNTTYRAFTTEYQGRSLRLVTDIEIFPFFQPGSPNPPQGKRYKALYDTGATHSVITPKVASDLNLPAIGAVTAGVGGGTLSTTSHLVNFGLPNSTLFAGISAAKMVLAGEIDALIGMDILGMGDFAVTHFGGRTVFSFCVPSLKRIDFAKDGHTTVIKNAATSRNGPCPCGSGKKYKGCHGRDHSKH